MAYYKTIPVDEETYSLLLALCQAYQRKQGAQVKALVKAEYEKLQQALFVPAKIENAKPGKRSKKTKFTSRDLTSEARPLPQVL